MLKLISAENGLVPHEWRRGRHFSEAFDCDTMHCKHTIIKCSHSSVMFTLYFPSSSCTCRLHRSTHLYANLSHANTLHWAEMYGFNKLSTSSCTFWEVCGGCFIMDWSSCVKMRCEFSQDIWTKSPAGFSSRMMHLTVLSFMQNVESTLNFSSYFVHKAEYTRCYWEVRGVIDNFVDRDQVPDTIISELSTKLLATWQPCKW